MVPITSLLVPIVVAAIVVFVASAILHMVLPFHRSDMRKVPNEDEFLAAVRKLNIPPGDYGSPNPGSPAGMKDPKFLEKMRQGPVVFMTVAPGREPGMASNLTMWFIFCLVVSLFGAYIAGRALAPGAVYLEVFRFAGATTFAAYALGEIPASIWYQKSWATTIKNVIDGLIYGLLTAGVFGWLWPR